MNNRKTMRYISGSLVQLEALFLILPILVGIIYKEKTTLDFLIVALICLICGRLIRGRRRDNITIYSTAGYASVAMCWIVISIFGALPLYLSGYFNNPVDALFEIVSGFTTTGATILNDVEILPRSILMWRSLSHWIGGMGILVLMLAILPMTGASGMNLMKAESPGPSVGKLVPKVGSTAKTLYGIYLFLTVLEMILLALFGCPIFDSINMAFATAGTGGYGVLNSSAGDYNTYIKIILTVFMILFGVNFNIYYLVITRHFKDALKSEELRAYLLIIAASIVAIAINTLHMFQNIGEAFLHSSFQVASIMTTTGFSTTDFNQWPELSRTILVLLMFVGACAGSTGGGIKVSRIVIMFKTVMKELAFIRHPRNIRKVHFEKKPIEHEVLRAVNIFLISYIFIFIISILLVSLDNHDGITNFTAVVATINNIGPGMNMVGPTSNFSFFSNLSKIVLIFDMLAGRLEIFPMLILGTLIWKKKRWN
ncbi:MAG: TrkH family potassium uptake protein [Lachnospiraceae bacterium]|nr:TrkH family potassium uptake protein [Lachnospiraceae bacterium]